MRLTLNKFAFWALLVWGGLNLLRLVSNQLPLLSLSESIGYGDGYILDTAENLRRDGVLYPALGPDHLVPSIYSPVVYGMLALAQMVAPSRNPYFGPRILELGWFLACVGASALVAQRLLPRRKVFIAAMLLASSFLSMTDWIMQLRGDFPGICCSLLTVYFLLSRKPAGLIAAGVFAGLAMQFKLTFVAAAVAGSLWLILHRRWTGLLRFALPAAVASIGLYALTILREPEMLQHILAMRQIVPHNAGVLKFFQQLLLEPAFLLGLAGLFLVRTIFRRRKPRWQLLTIFLALSLCLSLVTSRQAGANINYFYEAMFAATPFAALTLIERPAKPWGPIRKVLTVSLLIFCAGWYGKAIRRMEQVQFTVAQRNWDYRNLALALDGAKVFSSVSDVARLQPDRPVMEPLLLVLTRPDFSKLVDRLDAREFDVVITAPVDEYWRGVPYLARSLRTAIMASYEPRCLLGNRLYHFPKNQSSDVEPRLTKLGCQPLVCSPGRRCLGLDTKYEQFSGASTYF